jgi:hypothetical protein
MAAMPLPPPPPFMAIDPAAIEYLKQIAEDIPVDQFSLQVQNLVCLTAIYEPVMDKIQMSHSK